MNPQAPEGPPPYNPQPAEKNPYDFLDTQPVKKSLLPGVGGDKQKLLILIGGGLGLLALIGIILALVFGGAPSNKEQLMSLAKQQNELIRVSSIGVEKARDNQARNLALNAKLTLTTDQQPLLTALRSQKVKPTAKQLAASKNAKTDQILTDAEQTNRFDEVFTNTLQSQLVAYQKELKAAYDNPATGKKLKETLKTQYQNASLLINAKPEL
jgi:hypothetical protein